MRSILTVAAIGALLVSGLAAVAYAGQVAGAEAHKLPPVLEPVVYVQAGTGNVLSEFGPFGTVMIEDRGLGEGLSVYVTGESGEERFAYFDEVDRVWRFDLHGVTGDAAYVRVAPFSVVSRPQRAR